MSRILAASLAMVALPGAALAHVGPHEEGFAAGLVHALGAPDHLVGAVGLGYLALIAGGILWLVRRRR